MALNILSKVKTFLNLSKTDQDTFLTDLINEVEKEISNYLRQPISQTAINIKNILLDGDDVLLPYTVPCGIISIQYTEPFATSSTVIDPLEYFTYYKGSVQRIKFKNLYKNYIYSITVAVGWLDANIPLDILSVATDLVVYRFKESVKGENLLAKTTTSSNQNGMVMTNSYKGDFINSRLRLLDHYKIMTI